MRIPVVAGPTGAGKTAAAFEICRRHGLQMLSADSRQVYRGLNIGTAKPEPELCRQVVCHMLDVVDPDRPYSAADYARAATAVMERLVMTAVKFVVVGGAGLYLRALFKPLISAPPGDATLRARLGSTPTQELYRRLQTLDPGRAAQLHPNDRQRIVRALEICEKTGKPFAELQALSQWGCRFIPRYLILTLPRDLLYRRIDERFDAMMAAGLLEEVKKLVARGFGLSSPVANAYGYGELIRYIQGELTLDEAVRIAKVKSRAYAKRQLVWFRRIEGAEWLEYDGTLAEAIDWLEPRVLETFRNRV